MNKKSSPMPYNPEAERAVLGGLLIDPEQAGRWIERLRSVDFHEPRHAAVFSGMQATYERHGQVSVVLLDEQLKRQGELADIGQTFVHDLAATCESPALTPHYVADVVDNWAGRERLYIGNDLMLGKLTAAEAATRLVDLEERLHAIREPGAGAFSLEGLMAEELPPLRMVVPTFVPEGLVLLGSKRKLGKSWLVYALVIAVGAGGRWLGQPVEHGEALYLALEDGKRRLQDRGRKLLAGQAPPPGITIETDWPRLDAGGLRKLDSWLAAHPRRRAVVVDVLAKVRPPHQKWADSYAEDYAMMGSLKTLADRYHVAIVVVHHTRKAAAEDVFDELHGSMGLSGAADTLLVLARGRGEDEATLHVVSRDTAEGKYAVRFDKATGAWQLLGDAVELGLSAVKQDIWRVLKAAAPKTVSDQDVALALGYKPGQDYGVVRVYLSRMVDKGEIVSPRRGQFTIHAAQETPVASVTMLHLLQPDQDGQDDGAEAERNTCNNVTNATGIVNGHCRHEYAQMRTADGRRVCIHCEQPEEVRVRGHD